MPAEDQVMVASHDHFLIALSILISILAAYAARDVSDRVRGAQGRVWLAWLVSAATANGICTSSMHYTAMLALLLPVPVEYDWPTVILSLVGSILGSAAALLVLSRNKIGWFHVFAASIFMGGMGISCMHFIGMAAMRLQGMHHYSPAIVTLSIVLAIALSWMALWLAFLDGDHTPGRNLRNHGSALLRGAANPVMHFTAMAAVTFKYSDETPDLSHAVSLSSIDTLGIAIVPLMGLVVGLLTSLVDRLQKQKALLNELFEQAPQAVVLMGADNRIVRANKEFTRLFGYSSHEVLGCRLGELIVPDDSREEEQRYADHVAHGQRVDVECVRQRKDGSRLHVSLVRVPVSVPGGKIEVYAIYRDITERKQAEKALHESANRLRTLSHRLLEVQETERRHLARELHDEVGQLLTGLRLQLKPNSDLTVEAAKARFEQARRIVDDLLEKVRGLSFDLRPAVLDQFGLVPALLALFERYTQQTGVQVHLKHKDMEQRFAPELETTAYRIVQEGLTNVARHAGVAGATVRVWAIGDMLSIQIEDRGRGFDPAAAQATSRSTGLAGMRERVVLLNGILTIESQPGSGTHITAELPLNNQSRRPKP